MKWNKFNVSPKKERTLDGIVFASKKEMNRYSTLRVMELKGEILDLELQPIFVLLGSFDFRGKTIRAITYKADFAYTVVETSRRVVEDVKGHKTTDFKLKWKLLQFKVATEGLDIDLLLT